MQKEAKSGIKKLVEKYEEVKTSGKLRSYTEEQTKKDFILPLFEILGWDVYSSKDVSAEEHIKSSGRVDYGFYLDGRIKFYLEAKPLKADLHKREYADQAVSYSWNKGAAWAVLTDFESLKVFNAQDIKKSLADKLFFEISYNDYLKRFDQLWLLSKEAFRSDLLDKEAERVGKKFQKIPVSVLLYKDLQECRDILINELGQWNSSVDADTLDEGVQKLLDRLIFIRVAEDRKIENAILIPMARQARKESGGRLYQSMVNKFREFDKDYNSNLFTEHPFEYWEDHSGATEKVINILYGKEGYYEYDFKAMPSDVLGAVYENYLSHRLSKSKKGTTVSKDAGRRKEQGIYYTPSYIVDYIVKNALGPVLDKCHSIRDIKKIKVLDPACGSGSFLIKALEMIYNKYQALGAVGNEEFIKIQILEQNIYGVDLDPKAVEITRLNLLINSLTERMKMPVLKNIKNGNSLISGTDEELKKYFGKNFRDKKPFNWQEEFPEVFAQSGFDVVIGNPPYIRPHKLENDFKKYSWDHFSVFKAKSDIYAIFMQKSVDLLKNDGIASFIVSNTWVSLESFAALRKYILDKCAIQNLVLLPSKVFEGATVETIIFNFKKEENENQRKKNKISIAKIDDNNDFVEIQKTLQEDFLSTHLNMFDISHDKSSGQLLKKIEKSSKPLQNYVAFYYGIKTGDDPKFISNEPTTKEHRKLLCRSDFQRYQTNYNNEYVWYVPEIMRKNKTTARPGEKQRFENPKIIIQDIGKRLVATLDKENYYIKDALILHQKEKNKLEYILALINSKLLNYWYVQQFKTLSIAKNAFLILPIYEVNFSHKKDKLRHDELVKLADKMLKLNKELQKIHENTDKWNSIKSEIEKTDKKIDQEVYKLYGLTDKEIKIVENSIKN